MKRGIAALVAVAALSVGLSACGGTGSAGAQDGSGQQKTVETPKPDDLTGTWKQTNGNDKDHYQQATVTADKIEINWISPDSTSLYWSGSFTAPTKAGDYSWTSKGDKQKMASSLLASQAESKDFKYTNGEITYSASALGTTTTVRLKKQ